MILYWLILLVKKFVWLFRIPKPEELAYANINARCHVCGAKSGRLRCVAKEKAGPVVEGALPNVAIFCQHTCNECGARSFDPPISKTVNPGNTWPSIPRDDIEKAEDRTAFLIQSQEP
jgi:hypothetical protein